MKGYVVVLTEKVTGKKLYMGQEMDDGDNVGITWPTKNFKETRIFFDEKSAANEIPYFKFDFDNYDAKVVPVDITSPNLPDKDFGISTIKQVEDLCNAALEESDLVWSKNNEKIHLICKQFTLLKESIELINTLKYRVSLPPEWDRDYDDELALKNRIEDYLKKVEEAKIV